MKSKIVKKENNPVFKRDVVKIEIEHFGSNTPNRQLILKEAGKLLKTDEELIMIQKISTVYGSAKCIVKVHVYKKRKDLEKNEPPYLIKRLAKKEEEKKEEAPKAPEENKTEEKPAEKPKEEKKEDGN